MRTLYRSTLLTAAAAFAAVLLSNFGSSAQQKAPVVTVFKTASCGCCSKWVDHMKAAGFEMRVQDVEDIAAVKSRLGVAEEISSCHTSQVDGYVIEGHVPASSVQRLLKERPKIAGLAVPGMPMGSPGMEVPSGQKDAYWSSRSAAASRRVSTSGTEPPQVHEAGSSGPGARPRWTRSAPAAVIHQARVELTADRARMSRFHR